MSLYLGVIGHFKSIEDLDLRTGVLAEQLPCLLAPSTLVVTSEVLAPGDAPQPRRGYECHLKRDHVKRDNS